MAADRITPQKILLTCGVLASLVWIAMNAFIPMAWPEYSLRSQTISELSAIGAPTRQLWVAAGVVYTVLIVAFGCGVWTAARGNRRLRIAGALLVFSGVFGFFWPPMHLRGAALSLTDTLHIVWAAVGLLVMLLVMGLAATTFGRNFRLFTVATVAIWLVFGTLTSVEAPRVAANLPTPWIGVWERINAGAYLLWLVVFAALLIRRAAAAEPRGRQAVRTAQGVPS